MWDLERETLELYGTGSLEMVARELGKCKLDLRVAMNGHRIMHFSTEKGILIISYWHVSRALQLGE
jgi:hypothetical protein